MPDSSLRPTDNAMLASLTTDEWRRLSPYAERVSFHKGQILHDSGDVPRHGYFPGSGMFSVLASTEAGLVVQVATISQGEFAGVPAISRSPAPSQVVVTIPGEGYRIRAEPLRQEFQRCATFHTAVLKLVDRLLLESAQAVVCHRYHSVRERLARWLLDARDCTGVDVIELTQERIAELLAIPRSAISATTAAFQDRGWIRQRHGRIQILRRSGIETLACECYHVLRRAEPPTRTSIDGERARSTSSRSRIEGPGSFGT